MHSALQNTLDDFLQSNNSALILSIAKIFLKFTSSMPEIHDQVFECIRRLFSCLFSPSFTLTFSRSYPPRTELLI